MSDVFISFSSKDRNLAEAMLNALESRKIKCWISYRDADVGEDYASSIVKAIKKCRALVLIFSENSNNSQHVLNEINSAVNAGKIIVPFKVNDFDVSASFEYYLGKTHWLDAITPPLQKHIDLLCDKLSSILDKKEPEPTKAPVYHSSGECRMVSYEELISIGYTSSDIAIQLVENDYIICNGISEENEGTAEQWEKIIKDYSDVCSYLIDSSNKIVGNRNLVALSDEVFELVKKGQYLEKDISIDNVEFFGFPGEYNGYVLAFGILPDYRNTKNYMKIMNDWIRYIEDLSSQGVFFKEWCINVFSKEIESLIKGIGFRYICDNKVFGKIYSLKFLPLPEIKFYRQNKKLVQNYEKYYSENNEE